MSAPKHARQTNSAALGYIDQDGTLRVVVRRNEADPWLLRPEHTVPMRVKIQNATVFDS
jgi:hypothetical protein